jgi:hypothetical protein
MEISTPVPFPLSSVLSSHLRFLGNILVTQAPGKGYSLIFLDCGIVTKVLSFFPHHPTALSLATVSRPSGEKASIQITVRYLLGAAKL